MPRVAGAVLRNIYDQQTIDHHAHTRAWRTTSILLAVLTTATLALPGVIIMLGDLDDWMMWAFMFVSALVAGMWALLHGLSQVTDRARADHYGDLLGIARHQIAHLLTHAHDQHLSRVCACTGLRDGFPYREDGDGED